MNKKGSSIAIIFFIIVACLTIIIIAGVFIYGFDQIVSGLRTGDAVGAVNLTTVTDQSIGQLNNALLNNANLYAIIILFGMFLGMMAGGFVTRGRYPKMLFVVDILVLIFAYILAVYLSNAYETVLTSIPFSATYIGSMPTGSSFVLNLPLIVTIGGALTIILSYATQPRTKEEEVAGF